MPMDARTDGVMETKTTKRGGRTAVDPGEILLGLADLAKLLGISRRTLERERAAGHVPKPTIIIGSRTPRWSRATITRWLETSSEPKRR